MRAADLIWALREGTPHFGWPDDAMLGVPYARNLYDSDQRPLCGILSRVGAPMLIIHGRQDVLVPYETALEHHRLVPQSELETTAESHFMVFTDDPAMAGRIASFVARVERGEAVDRAHASAERIAAALAPFDPRTLPKLRGVAALATAGLLAVATFVSEDITSVMELLPAPIQAARFRD